MREIGCQIRRNGVGEIVQLWISVEVRKWQNHERQAGSGVGPGRCFALRLLRLPKYIGADRLPDIPVTDEASGDRANGRNRGQRSADKL